MASTNEEDPYLQVQQCVAPHPRPLYSFLTPLCRDVLSQMDTTRSLFNSYLRIRSLSQTTTSPELRSARNDLESALATLAEDLADLIASVQAAEANPSAFGLSAHEVARRKRLVDEIGGEVEDMREELAKTVVASNQKSHHASDDMLPDPSAFAVEDGDGHGADDYAAEFEAQQQEVLLREQDVHLDGVFQTVDTLRRQAGDMERELDEQREMLEDMDRLADRVGGRLQVGMDKLKYVVKHNEDRLSSWCIGLLIIVLCILLLLLLVL